MSAPIERNGALMATVSAPVRVPPVRIEIGLLIGDPACAAIVAVVKALERQGYGHARVDLNYGDSGLHVEVHPPSTRHHVRRTQKLVAPKATGSVA